MSDQVKTSEFKIVNGKKVRVYSLVLITDSKRKNILLGLKKRGFGVNKFNGFGGKLAKNETIEECAKREVFEECSLVVENLEKIAVLVYEFIGSEFLMEVHFFHSNQYKGTIEESEEMKPKWFPLNELPFEMMWCDDKYWTPYFFDGKHFHGYFKLKSDDEIVYQYLNTVDKDKEIVPIYSEVTFKIV